MPMYSAARAGRSPRRGARTVRASPPAAMTATRNSASPTPNIARIPTNAGRLSTHRWPTRASVEMAAPASSSGRRPYRSDAQPTTGRMASAARAKAPIATPAPAASAARRVVANGAATGSTIPPAPKNASVAANSARNGRVSRLGAAASVIGSSPGPRADRRLRTGRARGARRPRGPRQPVPWPGPAPNPVEDDRADLRLGAGESCGDGDTLARPRPVPFQRGQQLRDPVAGQRGGDQHLRSFGLRAVGIGRVS